jgi:hypothetical protein
MVDASFPIPNRFYRRAMFPTMLILVSVLPFPVTPYGIVYIHSQFGIVS